MVPLTLVNKCMHIQHKWKSNMKTNCSDYDVLIDRHVLIIADGAIFAASYKLDKMHELGGQRGEGAIFEAGLIFRTTQYMATTEMGHLNIADNCTGSQFRLWVTVHPHTSISPSE